MIRTPDLLLKNPACISTCSVLLYTELLPS